MIKPKRPLVTNVRHIATGGVNEIFSKRRAFRSEHRKTPRVYHAMTPRMILVAASGLAMLAYAEVCGPVYHCQRILANAFSSACTRWACARATVYGG